MWNLCRWHGDVVYDHQRKVQQPGSGLPEDQPDYRDQYAQNWPICAHGPASPQHGTPRAY